MAASVANYSLFQAIVEFGATDIGNAPKVSITLQVDYTEHLSSRTPSPEVDFTFTTKKTGTIDISLEEATLFNLALYALHDGYTTGAVTILKDSVIEGDFTITGTNDQGNAFIWALNVVQLRPKGTMELISGNNIAVIPISGSILSDPVDGFGTITAVA
ncbi:MAG: hypothetical protein U1E62_05450 [Alsobacter sp.]